MTIDELADLHLKWLTIEKDNSMPLLWEYLKASHPVITQHALTTRSCSLLDCLLYVKENTNDSILEYDKDTLLTLINL